MFLSVNNICTQNLYLHEELVYVYKTHVLLQNTNTPAQCKSTLNVRILTQYLDKKMKIEG